MALIASTSFMKPNRIADLARQNKRVLSLEIFPPKTPDGITTLLDHLKKLMALSPSFISVTYGAGGSTQAVSLEVLEKVTKTFPVPVVAHFTCVGSDRTSINQFLEKLKTLGVSNILALRGDPPQNQPNFDFSKQAFHYANELVTYLKTVTDMCIIVAGYPDGHPQAPNKESDWDNLKRKIDAGGELIVTQLFLDNTAFYEFVEGVRRRGITVPILPGILPIPSITTYEKIFSMCKTRIPPTFQSIIDQYSQDPEGFRKASVDYSRDQVRDLLAHNPIGIHYYCLNRSEMIMDVAKEL
jgi:methylenetetrahydrofolate reductase (NADPH)